MVITRSTEKAVILTWQLWYDCNQWQLLIGICYNHLTVWYVRKQQVPWYFILLKSLQLANNYNFLFIKEWCIMHFFSIYSYVSVITENVTISTMKILKSIYGAHTCNKPKAGAENLPWKYRSLWCSYLFSCNLHFSCDYQRLSEEYVPLLFLWSFL